MGCGFEVPPPATVPVYVPPMLSYKDSDLKTCPGYTTSLPEVHEIARGWMHWSKGQLSQFTRGEATERMLTGVEIFEAAINDLKSWCMTKKSEGGGMEG